MVSIIGVHGLFSCQSRFSTGFLVIGVIGKKNGVEAHWAFLLVSVLEINPHDRCSPEQISLKWVKRVISQVRCSSPKSSCVWVLNIWWIVSAKRLSFKHSLARTRVRVSGRVRVLTLAFWKSHWSFFESWTVSPMREFRCPWFFIWFFDIFVWFYFHRVLFFFDILGSLFQS